MKGALCRSFGCRTRGLDYACRRCGRTWYTDREPLAGWVAPARHAWWRVRVALSPRRCLMCGARLTWLIGGEFCSRDCAQRYVDVPF